MSCRQIVMDLRLPSVYRLVTRDSVTSTMDEAVRLARQGAEDGTLVWAREQTAGRGRLGRSWASPRGNLYLSLVLRPDCPPARVPQLGFLAALAIGDAIGSVAPPVDVTYKWPNDVLLNGRKVAGVLLESQSTGGDAPDFVILGCGVNIASFPRDAGYPATSLRFEGTPSSVTEIEVLEAFSRHFLSWVNRWLEDGFAPARAAWKQHAERLGEKIDVRLASGDLTGVFGDLDAEGYLLLRLDSGVEQRVAAGDILAPA